MSVIYIQGNVYWHNCFFNSQGRHIPFVLTTRAFWHMVHTPRPPAGLVAAGVGEGVLDLLVKPTGLLGTGGRL